jgi:hypothetical protein
VRTIKHRSQGNPDGNWHKATAGDIWHLCIHGLEYPLEIRANPPRVRLLEDAVPGGFTNCELLDPWPDAPEYWPPSSAPGAVAPGPAPLQPGASPPVKPPPRKRAAKAAKTPTP